jgi:hypothetical protein
MHIMLGTCIRNLRGRDEWNILKCTLHSRRVQKNFIILTILVEFLVISLFHGTKIPSVDMKVEVSFNFRKKEI